MLPFWLACPLCSDAPALGDFDGDHRSDVFMYGPGSLPDHIWLGRPDRAFRGAAVNVGRNYLPLVGDFNGNGHADILWYGAGAAPDVLWSGHANRVFTSRATTLDIGYTRNAALRPDSMTSRYNP